MNRNPYAWSVKSVRGEVSTDCLCHAFKAVSIGVILVVMGAGMATVGEYNKNRCPIVGKSRLFPLSESLINITLHCITQEIIKLLKIVEK